MKSVDDSSVSLVLLLMAASSLFSMIGLLQLNKMVQNDLVRSGLHFNYGWAVPYWNLMSFVFALGWVNIIAAIAFQSYLLMQRSKEAKLLTLDAEEQRLQGEQATESPRESESQQKESKPEAQEEEETPSVTSVPP